MSDSLDFRHGTSDEFINPYCDPCYEDEGVNVRVRGFCKDCVQFLCSDCHSVHRKLQSSRHHDVVEGEDIPKSQTEKPPRFEYCNVHPKLPKNVFCCEHKILLCLLCSSSGHKGCSIKTVENACKIVDVSETGVLYDKMKTLQKDLKAALLSVNKNINKIKDQLKTMISDAQIIYDQVIVKLNKLFDDIKNEIETSCHSQIHILFQRQKKYNDMIIKLDSQIVRLGELNAKAIDTKVFLRLQEIVSSTKKFTTELLNSHEQGKPVSLTLIPSQTVQEFLSSSFNFGTIRSLDLEFDANIVIPEIVFPVSFLNQIAAKPKTGQTQGNKNTGELGNKPRFPKPAQRLSKLKATKQGTYSVKLKEDADTCWISGMVITKTRRLLMTDSYNGRVKMFSHDKKFFVSVSGKPFDIAVISDKEAAVTTDNKSLVILDISGSQLSVKTTTQLSYSVRGISKYHNKLVVTSPYERPPSVKLIDQTGRVYWSVSSDQQRQPLFIEPLYIISPSDGSSSSVIVTDTGKHTLTLLNGDTGQVITRRELKKKYPRGVTTDYAGNVYVCYSWAHEVSVLSGDLSKENNLLSRQDGLSGLPHAIVYDEEAHRLIISYDCTQFSGKGNNDVDFFKLS